MSPKFKFDGSLTVWKDFFETKLIIGEFRHQLTKVNQYYADLLVQKRKRVKNFLD